VVVPLDENSCLVKIIAKTEIPGEALLGLNNFTTESATSTLRILAGRFQQSKAREQSLPKRDTNSRSIESTFASILPTPSFGASSQARAIINKQSALLQYPFVEVSVRAQEGAAASVPERSSASEASEKKVLLLLYPKLAALAQRGTAASDPFARAARFARARRAYSACRPL
jgi:hypothetical protein